MSFVESLRLVLCGILNHRLNVACERLELSVKSLKVGQNRGLSFVEQIFLLGAR